METERSSFFERFLSWLASTPRVGALHIQGTMATYLRLDGVTEAFSTRIEPGALQGGKVVDRAKLLSALRELYAQASAGSKRKEPIRTVVVVPSEPVYTQSVNIPNVGSERLEESAALNLQMVSPIAHDTASMSYEVVGEAEDHYELLAAFIDRRVVEEFQSVLEEAGFQPIIFEFSNLALVRLLERAVGAPTHASLGFYLSSDGLDFFIVKHGKLHFSYFRSWASIQGSAREISRELFDEVVTREVQKVVNFSLGKFKERPREVILIAQGLAEEVRALLASRFEIPVTPLEIGGGYSPPWYVVLGAAIRGKTDLERDIGINLATLSSRDRLFQEQAMGFVRLWRNVIAGVLALFIVFYAVSAYFLRTTERRVATQLEEFTARFNATELSDLAARAEEFNTIVGATQAVVATRAPWDSLLRALDGVMREHGVSLDRIEVSGRESGATLMGRAPSNDRLLAFKNELAASAWFGNVDLVVSRIATLEDGSVGFVVNFTPVFPAG